MLGSERRFYGYGPAGGDGRSEIAPKSGPSGQVEALLADRAPHSIFRWPEGRR